MLDFIRFTVNYEMLGVSMVVFSLTILCIRVGQISYILKTLKYVVSRDISNIIAKFQVI